MRRPVTMVLSAWFVLTLVFPASGLAKGKGLPSSQQRMHYCAQKLGECIADVGGTCSDTYEKAEHIDACMDAELAECNRRFGRSSRCLTSPRVIPGASQPGNPGVGAIQEDRPARPRVAKPRSDNPILRAPIRGKD